jgi:fatty-acyl-CoA synthase
MQPPGLTTTSILEHAESVHAGSGVITFNGEGVSRRSFADVAASSRRLAAALRQLGVGPGDRVATLCWNHDRHLEAYYAVPGLGAVLHTLNLRLNREQLANIISHAEDRILIVDAELVDLVPLHDERLSTVEHVVVVGGPSTGLGPSSMDYATLLSLGEDGFDFPEVDENEAAILCYTSGTTGDPKGILYSHRSTYLHSLAVCSGNAFALSERDRVLMVVPMFHANAWGLPYACSLTGADMVLPRRHVQGRLVTPLIEQERVTFIAAVPTVIEDVLRTATASRHDLSSLRLVICGGAPVPQSLIERWHDAVGSEILQAWGMTETSPLAAIARPPRVSHDAVQGDSDTVGGMKWRIRAGRPIHGVQMRIVSDTGVELPWDDVGVGEIQVRGHWVTGGYYRGAAPESFDKGWLRTGDVGRIDGEGFMAITDRAKDVIKSGGEWISSIALENQVMAHPAIVEAAVIGVPDDRWQERPLVCFVVEADAHVTIDELRAHVALRLPRWWTPERWARMDAVPKTSVGKFDKKALRCGYENGDLAVVRRDAGALREGADDVAG